MKKKKNKKTFFGIITTLLNLYTQVQTQIHNYHNILIKQFGKGIKKL